VIRRDGDRLLLEGPVTISTVTALLAQCRAMLAPGACVLDFKAVTAVDSSAVALVLECMREAQLRDFTLTLANLPGALQNLAQLYAVSELLQAGAA
jgi:phospholipid transport system transporter-binding protein